MKRRPIALIILDGWGISDEREGNAVMAAHTPTLDALFASEPHTEIRTSGRDVGLPDGQMGNSEVGHTNIGAGRIVYQDLMRINRDIEDGEIARNEVLLAAMRAARESGHALHIAGLLSDGGVHSHIRHLEALLEMASKEGPSEVYVHAFYDGRDTPPTSGYGYTEQLLAAMDRIGTGKIATVAGRYYAMDRDNRWERVARAYRCLTSDNYDGKQAESPLQAIRASYDAGVTDEFIEPVRIVTAEGKAVGRVRPGDSFIFFNFRPDRARELTRAFMQPDFSGFDVPRSPYGLHYVTMTEYDAAFASFDNLHVAYPPIDLRDTLGEIVSKAGLKQLRIAETEKYAHVTFFLNGGREEPYDGEDRILIPSPKVATYDLKPEMSQPEVTEALMEALDKDRYDVIVLNYANCDMVGHTGVFDAAVKALEAVDRGLSRIVPKILSLGGVALITADHGNLEEMIDPVTHGPFTAHTTNPVPLIVAGLGSVRLKSGRLADLAPTLLALAGLAKPDAMTGQCLIE